MIDAPQVEIQCLAQTIHGEARGESLRGQEAVAQVVINRTRHPRYPKTICGVVQQRNQFSGYKPHLPAPERFYTLAKRVLGYKIPIHNYRYFNTRTKKPSLKIGRHFFWN